MKNNLAFISLFLCFLLSNTQTYTFTYMPMKKRTINFGDDVCYYKDISNDSHFIYVKPCEEGKECTSISTTSSNYDIHVCQEISTEKYDNEGATCKTYDFLNGIDCTGYSCNKDSKCVTTCQKNQFYDSIDNKCIDTDPGICTEYEFESNGSKKSQPKKSYEYFNNKECVQIELKKTESKLNIYQIEKVLPNYLVSLDDGKYIDDVYDQFYCKSGYALYFYGNGELENPNKDNPYNEELYPRCVTVLGRDKNGVIKYKIGDGEEKYYDPQKLYQNSSKRLLYNDKYLMLRLEFFEKYKNQLESLGCKDKDECEDNELSKWKFFYYNIEYYYLYQNEPQVLEYLIQNNGYKYKAEHTSPTDSSSLLNIKYLALLSLLFLF